MAQRHAAGQCLHEHRQAPGVAEGRRQQVQPVRKQAPGMQGNAMLRRQFVQQPDAVHVVGVFPEHALAVPRLPQQVVGVPRQ